jgi:hypothetical protein
MVMLEPAASFVGKYVGGRYHVQVGLDPFEAGIVAAHEEAHGILRRSSAFGAILTTARRAVAATSGNRGPFLLHALASRSRTSEEVHATYQSFRTAASFPERHDTVREILQRHPSYRLYFDIGEELVGREPIAPLANAALDALLRFCWSARPLAAIKVPIRNLDDLRKIPSSAFPDTRLHSLRRTWEEEDLRQFMDAVMGEEQAKLRELFGKPFQELYHPFASALQSLIPPGAAFIGTADFDRQLQQKSSSHVLFMASIEESLVQKGYAHLARKYAGTPLEALGPDELNSYVMKVRKAYRSSAEVPEVTLIRSRPTEVRIMAEPPSRTDWRLVFIRTRESFDQHFAVVGTELPARGRAVVYSVQAAPPEDLQADEALPVQLEPADPRKLATAVRKLSGRLGLAVVFASVVAQAPAKIWPEVESLHALGAHIWLVGDLAPRQCVRMARSRMPEARAFWYSPSHPNVGGLIMPQVGNAGPLQGVVYMGSRVSMVGLVRGILIDELGDDFRGFGPTLHVYEESYRREKEGQFIARWLLATERRLG